MAETRFVEQIDGCTDEQCNFNPIAYNFGLSECNKVNVSPWDIKFNHDNSLTFFKHICSQYFPKCNALLTLEQQIPDKTFPHRTNALVETRKLSQYTCSTKYM